MRMIWFGSCIIDLYTTWGDESFIVALYGSSVRYSGFLMQFLKESGQRGRERQNMLVLNSFYDMLIHIFIIIQMRKAFVTKLHIRIRVQEWESQWR